MSDSSTREDRIAAGCLQVAGFLFFALIFLVSVWPSGDNSSDSASSDIAWDTYDVTIDVREDGSVHVTEHQEITFDGRYTVGFAEIPMERIESIDNVSISVEEGVPGDSERQVSVLDEEPQGDLVEARQLSWTSWNERPNTFRTQQDGAMFVIEYAFDPTPRFAGYAGLDDYENATRTIVLEYDAYGVIRDYPDAEEPWQQIHWLAISDEVTSIAPIDSASVTVNLPANVATEDLVVVPEPDTQSGNQIIWSKARMDEGDSFDVQAAFPTITEATSPAWQDAADARDASLEERETRLNAGRLMMLLAGIGIAVIGGVALLYAWFRSIREPQVAPVHTRVTEPPGSLSAVLVGSLMDEAVDPRDIAAGVLDLDKQGIITIRNGEQGEAERYYLTLNDYIPAKPLWARQMLQHIFGKSARRGTTVGFSALRELFGAHRHSMQQAIDQTLVDEGYYVQLPETSRKHWGWVTKAFPIVGLVAAAGILAWARGWTPWSLIPLVVGVVLYVVAGKLAPHIAMKTMKGAETAALWSAFQNHLSTDRYLMSKERREHMDVQYAPWLVAFGMQQGWLSEMNRAPWDKAGPALQNQPNSPKESSASPSSATSTWIWGEGRAIQRGDGGTSRPGSSIHARPPAWRPTGGSWDAGSWGDMQDLSNRASSSLGSASDGLFSMVGDMLESLGSGSGSGGGGGSSSGGRRSGGSSRSGGGRSRSSSGGGRRGFR